MSNTLLQQDKFNLNKKIFGMQFDQKIDYNLENTYLVNQDYKFIACVIPKVASTSLKNIILDLDKITSKKDLNHKNKDIRKEIISNLRLKHYSTNEKRKLLSDRSYFKFTFVRNPWSRLVSAYISKFIKFVPEKECSFDLISDFYQQQNIAPNFQQGITFREFIEYVCTNDNNKLDRHWKPQYLFLGDTNFDFIGKLETIDRDWQYVRKELGIKANFPKVTSNTSKYNNLKIDNIADLNCADWKKYETFPSYQNFYQDKQLKKMVTKKYKIDINILEYEF